MLAVITIWVFCCDFADLNGGGYGCDYVCGELLCIWFGGCLVGLVVFCGDCGLGG